MDGLRNDEGFKPHHRIAAARELIKRGFDETYTQSAPADHTAHEERPELIIDNSEFQIEDNEYLESEENRAEVIEILKRAAEQVTPEEREAHEEAMRGVDLSMWDNDQPPSPGR